ncbi:hypothetical protein ACS0TY_028134 [Phlomoides rotata]
MPNNPMDSTTSGENTILGPDYFSFYKDEAKSLLSQDDGLLPYAHHASSSAGKLHGVVRQKDLTENSCQTKERNNFGSASLFSDEIGDVLSESKKERLKSLLRQSVITLTKEVDEMVNPVLSVCRIRSCLRSKERLLKSDASTHKADKLKHPNGKIKASSGCTSKGKARNAKNVSSGIEGVEEDLELDDDLHFILENDSNKVEELLKSHTNEVSATLNHMGQNLEEFLNIVMTTCRAMTIAEKQQLRKLIQNLPSKNLDRVADIVQFNKPPEQNSSNKLRVDLNELDNVTLWRLYFYVSSINANSTK